MKIFPFKAVSDMACINSNLAGRNRSGFPLATFEISRNFRNYAAFKFYFETNNFVVKLLKNLLIFFLRNLRGLDKIYFNELEIDYTFYSFDPFHPFMVIIALQGYFEEPFCW